LPELGQQMHAVECYGNVTMFVNLVILLSSV
jgi:hypothetical protein